jgi:3-hydroxyisobutyrate dehydrogenase
MAKAAFIGLGNMGAPMAANLVKAGWQVRAFDLSPDARARAADAGARPAESLAEAVASAEAVVTMLPAGRHVKAVYLGEAGLLAYAPKGALLIDSSTIDVETARQVIGEANGRGFAMVDAPVSGGVGGATAGTLTFMVGGADAAFERARPVLAAMGRNIFHAGGPGNGQAAKIANNMLLGITMIGTCEAFNLAEKLGLDAQTFFNIASTASGQSWSMTSYCPAPGPVPAAPSNRDYKPGFAASMMLKDLRLAQEAAHAAHAATPLGAQAEALYALMEAAGRDDLDFSGVMRLIRGDL